MGDGGWVRVVVRLTDDDPLLGELAADALWAAGTAGIEEAAGPGGEPTLLAGFPDADAAASGVRALADLGLDAEVVAVADHGLDAWRAHAVPVAAPPCWLVPAWVDPDPALLAARPDLDVVVLDPGRTFGSGSHPTTRLVLATLPRLVADLAVDAAVLDVGTGSGVLAVVAARLGAGRVLATDVEPTSPEVVAANAAANGVADRIEATTAPLAALVAGGGTAATPLPAAVVLANLLAPVVADLAADLVAAVAPGGHLVVSGLLEDRWRATTDRLVDDDGTPLPVAEVTAEDGWIAAVLRRP